MKIDSIKKVVAKMMYALALMSLLLGRTVAADRPNIVFILADDLGWTDLACYGSAYYETPHIDRLAAAGMRFRNGYSCGPNCQPTRAALMTGQYGPRTGVYTVGHIDRFNWRSRPLRPVDNVETLALQKATIAEALKAAGYTTGLFGKWHLGGKQFHPSHQGFDEAVVTMGKHFDFVTEPPVNVPTNMYLADFLTDRAVAFIEKHRERPFFLCLHHFAVHSPHVAKPVLVDAFKNKTTAAGHSSPVYAAMIASLDESVGRVLARLDALQLSDRTLVIFTSDNGGVGGYAREALPRSGGITDNSPLRGGKGMLYEGGIRVPYIFAWRGRIPPGKTSDVPINSVDLYPTLLEITGANRPRKHELDGASYAAILTGAQSDAKRNALFWHFPGYLGAGATGWRTTPAGAVRAGDWKLLEFFEDDRLELYQLSADPGERTNLVTQFPEQARALHRTLAAWRKQIEAPMPVYQTAAIEPGTNSPPARRNPSR